MGQRCFRCPSLVNRAGPTRAGQILPNEPLAPSSGASYAVQLRDIAFTVCIYRSFFSHVPGRRCRCICQTRCRCVSSMSFDKLVKPSNAGVFRLSIVHSRRDNGISPSLFNLTLSWGPLLLSCFHACTPQPCVVDRLLTDDVGS